MDISRSGIAVVESRWFPGDNITVAPLFNILGNIFYDNPNAYHYEMVGCTHAFQECLPRIASDKGIRYVYLATHGSPDALHLHGGDQMSRTVIRNCLTAIKGARHTLNGLYFGSCGFGTLTLAEYLYDRSNPVTWIAGYNNDIDWVESSVVDLQFFNLLLSATGSERDKIEIVAKRIKKKIGPLCDELGFGIYVRKRGTGGVRNLLDA